MIKCVAQSEASEILLLFNLEDYSNEQCVCLRVCVSGTFSSQIDAGLKWEQKQPVGESVSG